MGCVSNKRIGCVDAFGCPDPAEQCPDFLIKRHDTKPAVRYDVEDCDGPIDLTDLVCEVSMWAEGKLKTAITVDDTYFALADNIGFEQAMVGDIIVMSRVRAPEQMLVTGFDEANKLIQVQRGYNGSVISAYSRGSVLRIFRVLNSIASTEMTREDLTNVDGTTDEAVLTKSTLVYDWQAQDTCLPGCYWLEFKLLKMESDDDEEDSSLFGTPSVSTSFVSYTASQTGCELGDSVEWVQRYPTNQKGLLVQILDSPTAENVIL
jgi:hypothetical protein